MTQGRSLAAFAVIAGVTGCASDPGSVPISTLPAPTARAVPAPDLPESVASVPLENSAASPVSIALGAYDQQRAAPVQSVDIGAYDRPVVAGPTPQPVYVQSVGQPLRRGMMAPVRDDPFEANTPAPTRASSYNIAALKAAYHPSEALSVPAAPARVRNAFTPAFGKDLSRSALSRLNPNVAYVADYKKIGYPWGDVPESTGVCSDVVIRSYRGLGIDLQSMIHEDMRRAFAAYPSQKIYGLNAPDTNIDHRRVVNIEAFFERVGASIPVGSTTQPGDVITWRLSGGEPHIGVVVDRRDPKTGNLLIVHNLGGGVQAEDLLDYAPAHGHYRFAPDQQSRMASLALKRG